MITNCRLAAAALLGGALAAAACSRRGSEDSSAAQGIVEYEQRVLGFELGGRVTEIPVIRGDRVKKGQRLARLDDELARTTRSVRTNEERAARAQLALLESGAKPEDIRSLAARVKAARTSEAQAKRNLERERELNRRGVTPQAMVDDLESQLDRATAERQSLEQTLQSMKSGARHPELEAAQARAEAASAVVKLEEERLVRHELRADADGVVLDVHVESGEIVGAGAPVVTLADTRAPYADVFVPQAKVGGIRVGAPARLKVDSLPDSLPAKVESIGQRTEFTPRFLFSNRERPNLVIRVRERAEDPAERLHAGLPAFVQIDEQK
jgi:HlyD family secretion protein